MPTFICFILVIGLFTCYTYGSIILGLDYLIIIKFNPKCLGHTFYYFKQIYQEYYLLTGSPSVNEVFELYVKGMMHSQTLTARTAFIFVGAIQRNIQHFVFKCKGKSLIIVMELDWF